MARSLTEEEIESDRADERERREIVAGAYAAYRVLIDPRLDQKYDDLEILVGLVAVKEATWSEEARTGRWQ
jgi:hypothetical protein